MGAARTTDEGLTVEQMSKATGVSASCLRIWEYRYGWPRPDRQKNGYRLYQRILVPQVKRLAALVCGTSGKPATHLLSDILRDGFPSWPSSESSSPAMAWTRYAQLPSAHAGAATEFRARLDDALRRRKAAVVVEMMHESNISLRPHERRFAAWLPAFFGAMEWMRAGRPLPADVGRVIGRVAGADVLADLVARWQTADVIG